MAVISDIIVKVVPVLVSVVALVVSFAAYRVSSSQLDIANAQLEAVRQHNRLSVKPKIQIVPYAEGIGPGLRNGIYITNVGLGPAIIKSMQIIDGASIHQLPGADPWPVILTNMGLDSLCFRKGLPIPNSAILPGKEHELVAIVRRIDKLMDCAIPAATLVAKNNLRFKVVYESMYEEPFTFDGPAVIRQLELLQAIEPMGAK